MADVPAAARDAAEKRAGRDMAAHRKRAQAAWAKHGEWQDILDDAYDYVAPQRRSTRLTKQAGARTWRIFDNTGPVSHMRVAGKLQQDLFPPGEPFFALEPGPAVAKLGMSVDDARAECEDATAQITPSFMTGEWDMANIEMLADTAISTGFMFILDGDEVSPVRFVSASQDEVAIDLGPFGQIGGFFFRRKYTRRVVLETWKRGTFSKTFTDQASTDGEADVEVAQDCVWNMAARRWELIVYLQDAANAGDGDAPFWEETSRECPCIGSRYHRLPGQVQGWGPVLMTMPTIKTLNKVVELILRTAAINMAGIYTRIDDGVFNPDTARVEPGAFWTVARNGGPLGPSIQRLATAGDAQIGNLVLNDLRQQVHLSMNDQQLPPDGQSPRAAAEIIERIKRMGQDHAGAFGRMVHETASPAVRRVMEVLGNRGILKTKLRIDQLLVQLRIVSPMGLAFKAQRAQNYLNWVQAGATLGGPDMMHQITPFASAWSDIGHDLGIEASKILTMDQRQAIQMQVQQQVQTALAAMAKQQQQPPPPNGDPAQGAAA